LTVTGGVDRKASQQRFRQGGGLLAQVLAHQSASMPRRGGAAPDGTVLDLPMTMDTLQHHNAGVQSFEGHLGHGPIALGTQLQELGFQGVGQAVFLDALKNLACIVWRFDAAASLAVIAPMPPLL
jgi:hypothetical protein